MAPFTSAMWHVVDSLGLGNVYRTLPDGRAHTWGMSNVVLFWFPWIVLGLALVVWAYGLLDFLQTDERDIRSLSRPLWLAILVCGSVFGVATWMIAGRPQRPKDR